MKIFSSYRGSHMLAPLDINHPSIIKLEGADGLIATDCIFVNSFQVGLAERVNVISCFRDYNYIFAFGHNPTASQYTISFTAFLLGKDCNSFSGSGILKKIKDYYNEYRVSKRRKLVQLSVGSLVVKGILAGMSLKSENAELNTITVSMSLIGIEGISNSAAKKSSKK